MSSVVLLNVLGLYPPEGEQQIQAGATETHATVGIESTAPQNNPQQQTAPSPLPMFIWMAVIVAGMWFFMIRPQRKREKQMRELQASISAGDNVVTSSGLFGKVADIGEDCFVVEFGTNRGVRIPVLKADVIAVRSPKLTPQSSNTSANADS